MKARTFRLEESDIERLEQLAKARGETVSDAIRFAIRNAANSNTSNMPSDGELLDEIRRSRDLLARQVEAMRGELAAKNEQIASLQRIAEAAQDATKAAQVLQAQAVSGELPSGEGEQRRSWWSRLFGGE